MERWTGVLKVSLSPNNGGTFFKVAASLLLSSSTKTLAVPSMNALFFKGDRAEGTGNPVIERLSESKNIAEILVSKLGASVNVWVVEASTFYGPFAVYKELVPSVNSLGEPKNYDPDGFHASNSIAAILSKSIYQVENSIIAIETGSAISGTPPPATAVFGFSKGGTVVNQIVAELANLNAIKMANPDSQPSLARANICPTTARSFLHSISQLHYLDVGLNCPGAYLTDQALINKIPHQLLVHNSSLRVMFHGTPRQWHDPNRSWICEEKDSMVRLLRDAFKKYGSGLQVLERLYFAEDIQVYSQVICGKNVYIPCSLGCEQNLIQSRFRSMVMPPLSHWRKHLT